MASERIYCDNCGALCSPGDIYCKSCFTKLTQEPAAEEAQVISGIDNDDLMSFIDKNADYYMEKLAGKDGKKHFFSINWAALALGNNWFLYRNMLKVVVIHILCTLLALALYVSGVSALYDANCANYRSSKEAVIEYIANGGETLIKRGELAVWDIVPEYEQLLHARDAAQTNYVLVCIILFLVLLGFEILFRLSANCIYRNHIVKNIGYSEGGASIATMYGNLVILNLVEIGLEVLVILLL